MARRAKGLPAPKPGDRPDEESLLIRSAEALGSTIAMLQRQLNRAKLLSVLPLSDGDARSNAKPVTKTKKRNVATGNGSRKSASRRAGAGRKRR